MKIELDVEIPEGYEVEKFRLPKGGDLYLDRGTVREAQFDFAAHECIILRKKKNIAVLFVPDAQGDFVENGLGMLHFQGSPLPGLKTYRREDREK